jgi:hypothetical protein
MHAVWNLLQSYHISCANEIAPLLQRPLFQNFVHCVLSQETLEECTNSPGFFLSRINICGFQMFTKYVFKRYMSTPTGFKH